MSSPSSGSSWRGWPGASARSCPPTLPVALHGAHLARASSQLPPAAPSATPPRTPGPSAVPGGVAGRCARQVSSAPHMARGGASPSTSAGLLSAPRRTRANRHEANYYSLREAPSPPPAPPRSSTPSHGAPSGPTSVTTRTLRAEPSAPSSASSGASCGSSASSKIYGHRPRGAEWRACLGKHFAHCGDVDAQGPRGEQEPEGEGPPARAHHQAHAGSCSPRGPCASTSPQWAKCLPKQARHSAPRGLCP